MNRKWSVREEYLLREKRKQRFPVTVIAKRLHRTVDSVNHKISRIVGVWSRRITWTQDIDAYLRKSDGVIQIKEQAKCLGITPGAITERRRRLGLSGSTHHGKTREPEYTTLYFHLRYIRKGKTGYKNMPFFSAWNPHEGGNFLKGYNWILSNLGRRPSKKHELHVMNRGIGVWPGNLCWLTRSNHWRNEERYQMMARIKELEDEVSMLRLQLRKAVARLAA